MIVRCYNCLAAQGLLHLSAEELEAELARRALAEQLEIDSYWDAYYGQYYEEWLPHQCVKCGVAVKNRDSFCDDCLAEMSPEDENEFFDFPPVAP